MKTSITPKISIAPMLDLTDRHFRYFVRLLTRHTKLYTEMIAAPALIHGDKKRFLKFDEIEHPIAIQLSGSNPADLATCAKFAQDAGFDEINLNVGCPSDRVQSGKMGLCLMAYPQLVANCLDSMQQAVEIPVSIKTRLGFDNNTGYEHLSNFITTIIDNSNCTNIILHARCGFLKGLSPKENRSKPPIDYQMVYKIKKDFPLAHITINGDITTLDEAAIHLQHVDEVMIGRAAYKNPYMLATVDQRFHNDKHPILTREEIFEKLTPYIEKELALGTAARLLARPLLGLYHGQPNAKTWKKHLNQSSFKCPYGNGGIGKTSNL